MYCRVEINERAHVPVPVSWLDKCGERCEKGCYRASGVYKVQFEWLHGVGFVWVRKDFVCNGKEGKNEAVV
jgi:hypothetical protein